MRPSTDMSPTENEEAVKLVFCNPDLLWGNEYPTSRLGQGGFRVAFEAVYHALTSKAYPCIQYGKPTKATYAYAEEVLRRRLKELLKQSKLKIADDADEKEEEYTPNVLVASTSSEYL